jgi:hypothetical protein
MLPWRRSRQDGSLDPPKRVTWPVYDRARRPHTSLCRGQRAVLRPTGRDPIPIRDASDGVRFFGRRGRVLAPSSKPERKGCTS